MGSVLVVDDNPVIRQTMSEVMEDHGLVVLCAANGEQALQIMRTHPDLRLVMADVVMPGMSGLRLAEAAGHDERLRSIPVVLMTAVTSLSMPENIPHITKPFTLDTLLTFVTNYLRD